MRIHSGSNGLGGGIFQRLSYLPFGFPFDELSPSHVCVCVCVKPFGPNSLDKGIRTLSLCIPAFAGAARHGRLLDPGGGDVRPPGPLLRAWELETAADVNSAAKFLERSSALFGLPSSIGPGRACSSRRSVPRHWPRDASDVGSPSVVDGVSTRWPSKRKAPVRRARPSLVANCPSPPSSCSEAAPDGAAWAPAGDPLVGAYPWGPPRPRAGDGEEDKSDDARPPQAAASTAREFLLRARHLPAAAGEAFAGFPTVLVSCGRRRLRARPHAQVRLPQAAAPKGGGRRAPTGGFKLRPVGDATASNDAFAGGLLLWSGSRRLRRFHGQPLARTRLQLATAGDAHVGSRAGRRNPHGGPRRPAMRSQPPAQPEGSGLAMSKVSNESSEQGNPQRSDCSPVLLLGPCRDLFKSLGGSFRPRPVPFSIWI